MHDRFRILESEKKFLLFNKILGCYCSNKGHKKLFWSFMIKFNGMMVYTLSSIRNL